MESREREMADVLGASRRDFAARKERRKNRKDVFVPIFNRRNKANCQYGSWAFVSSARSIIPSQNAAPLLPSLTM